MIDPDAIPIELRARPQWVVWKHERRKGGKWTKVPYRVDARTPASTTDPRTWGTFEQAIARAAEAQGTGYVFSADDPFCGIDLDDCRDPASGEVHPAAAGIVLELDSYTEISPSGTGLHIIVRAALDALTGGDGRRTTQTPWGGKFEIYDRGRYFTVTGQVCSLAQTEVRYG